MRRYAMVLSTVLLAVALLVSPASANGPGDHGPPDGVPPVGVPSDPPVAPPGDVPPDGVPPDDVPRGEGPPADPGLTAERLAAAGWHCFDPDDEGPLGVHCVPPGSPLHPDSNTAGKARGSVALVFDAESGEFLGTTVMRSSENDLSHLPCGRDGSWSLLDALWSCHHAVGGPIAL